MLFCLFSYFIRKYVYYIFYAHLSFFMPFKFFPLYVDFFENLLKAFYAVLFQIILNII